MPSVPSPDELAAWVVDARERTIELVTDLSDQEWLGPRLAIVNPLHWEIGHVAWFQEWWVLRQMLGRPPLRADGDALYDSAKVAHDTRWDLPLPNRAETLAYLDAVRDGVLASLRGEIDARLRYFVLLSIFHEDMHGEAIAYTRQTLGYAAPSFMRGAAEQDEVGACPGDCAIPGGSFALGASPGAPFVFDNEKWAHEVEVRPFAIARAPVTQAAFVPFVEDGGYRRAELWSEDGWRWRRAADAHHPVYWRRAPGGVGSRGWERRVFDAWRRLEPDRPVLHVNAHEAEAFCRWAGRRLPTELEWEVAAAGARDVGQHGLNAHKHTFPWGEAAPDSSRAHLDARGPGCLDVGALAAGESAFGCRQLIGNVWEWTATPFEAYPGFVRDPYAEYSEPWFGTHRVLRGGCFVTRARLIRNTWRNFYTTDRRDVWAGFRTCAIDA